MKKLSLVLISLFLPLMAMAQGWPAQYGGVMLQAFYWDSYNDSKWTVLESQANDLEGYFDLVWIPQSANCNGTSMGYDPVYWFASYNSSFGNKRELKSMIQTFKDKGIKTIGDVVINHRKSVSGWFGFQTETYNGVTYRMTAADVCLDDDGGKAKTQADKDKVTLGNNDTGEDWAGMRDLDHTSENVQNTVKAYLNMLINDLGYAGFRYDMVKGYSPTYTGMYNTASNPEFSVGECWDSSNTIRRWIDGTKVDDVIQSAAFDFQFKYVLRNAVENKNWSYVGRMNDNNWPLISNKFSSGNYRRYAVTFIENHDTQLRNDGTSNGPLKRDTLAANAYMLAMPGTPCVFLPHWLEYSKEIKAMITARKFCGIHNMSTYKNCVSNSTYYYADSIDNKLLVVVGQEEKYTPDASQWIRVLSGYHYAYYFNASMNTAWVDLVSGSYEGEQQAYLAAVTTQADAKVCYSINNGVTNEVDNGTTITIPVGTTTLKVWLANNPNGALTRTYDVSASTKIPLEIPDFCTVSEGEVCAFFEAPSSWTGTIKCYTWNTNSGNIEYSGAWPGKTCTKLGQTNRGLNVWKWTFATSDYKGGGTPTQPTHIIFNNGAQQTENLVFQNGGFYTKEGIVTGIRSVNTTTSNSVKRYHTIDGRFAGTDFNALPHGIYVVNGKKVVR